MKRKQWIAILICMLALFVAGCTSNSKMKENEPAPVETARIGAMTGSENETYVLDNFKHASYLSFESTSDLMQALKSGKIDYACMAEIDGVNYKRSDQAYQIRPENLLTTEYCLAVKKSDTELLNKMDELIQQYYDEGIIAQMKEHWIRPDGTDYIIDEIPTISDGPVLTVAFCSELEPSCFIKDGKPVGYDVELISRLAYDMGYQLKFMNMQFSALIAALESGRADVAISGIAATEERKQKVNFTIPYYEDIIKLVWYDTAIAKAADKGFWASAAESFQKTFITEGRWKLFASGIGITLLLSIGSGILGILLGFCFCLIRMSKVRALNGVMYAIIRILQGTPIVVLLMVFYYIIFGKTGLDGIAVSILAFGLNFGAYAAEILLNGINSVDKGQKEAAEAIGFTQRQTFLKIVFPQAARRFLPVLKGEYISLVKMTSVVGYVAVQDLTKVSDIIRSRTYEAFFPLIVTAILYFCLAIGLSSLLKLVEVKIDPKHRPRTLKGVKLQ